MLHILKESLINIVFWGILFPFVFLFATPVILIKSFFGDGSYFKNFGRSYKRVFKWWWSNL